jgi:foldase protein PrsA
VTPRRRGRLVALSIAACVLIGASCGSASPAASVNGADITDARLGVEVDLYSFLAALNQQPCGEKEEGESAESACARFTLSNLIQQEFVDSFAAANDVSVTKQEITSIIADLDGGLGADQVDGQLKRYGLERADLRVLAGRVLVYRAVQQGVAEERLTDDELRALYEQQLLSYITVQVDHILVKTKAEAERVYRKATAPGATEEDFFELAGRLSIDPSAQQNSGALGSAVASTYVPEFANAAVALEPGEISRPVQSEFGWHVIRMVDKEVMSFEDARPGIVSDQAVNEFDEWLRDQAETGAVAVNPKYGRYDVRTLQVVRISSTATDAGPASASPAVSVTP